MKYLCGVGELSRAYELELYDRGDTYPRPVKIWHTTLFNKQRKEFERNIIMDKECKEGSEMIGLKIDEYNRLLLCAKTAKDDYYIMRNLLSMEPLEESAKECIRRMEFREPIFKILDNLKRID